MSKISKREALRRRHFRLRKRISGTAERPRMSVFRSNANVYVQFIDDENSVTLASASTLDKEFKAAQKVVNVDSAKELGKLAGERALANNIKGVIFDRGGFMFHGKVKAVAEGAREAGLVF